MIFSAFKTIFPKVSLDFKFSSSPEEQIKFPLHEEHSSDIDDENLKSKLNLGKIVLKAENITARYALDLPPALKNISFELVSGTMLH